jgi:hypothetical protein
MIRSCSKCGNEYEWTDNVKKMMFKNVCRWCLDVDRAVKDGFIDRAIESARIRAKYSKKDMSKRLTPEEKEEITRSCIEKGMVTNAIRAAQLRNRPLSVEEIAILMDQCIRNGDLAGAQRTADIRRQGLSLGEVDSLVDVLIDKGDLDKAFEASSLGASAQAFDSLIQATIEEGTIWKVRRLVERRGTPLTEREAQLLVQIHTERGNVVEALETARLRGIALSSAERHRLAQAFINKKWRYCGSREMEMENTALAKMHTVHTITGDRSDLKYAVTAATHAAKDTIGYVIETFAKEEINDEAYKKNEE